MDPEERRRIETAMAKISLEKRTVEADPAAAMRESIAVAREKFKRRLLWILLIVFAAAAIEFYLRSRG